MFDAYLQAVALIFQPSVLMTILIASVFGLVVGCIPGLTATMAIALFVPMTFYMDPIPAVGAIVALSAMAIFAGDIPGCLLRIPGTPASAAYVDDAYEMSRKGQAEMALGICLVFSVIGGLFGTAVMMLAAPAIAEFALSFGSVEFFWMAVLGLIAAAFIGTGRPLKGAISLVIGLSISLIGMNNPTGLPRFTFGVPDLLSGVSLIPVMVGMFAVSEVLRYMTGSQRQAAVPKLNLGPIFAGMWRLAVKYPGHVIRGSVLGTVIGIQPGSGADMAAWMAYATAKKTSKEPEKFGTGHPEGLIAAGAANNASLAGAWIPALVFGIPGDSVTAIAIGVLMMKGMDPGPAIFLNAPQNIYAVFLVFVLANLLMLPLGWAMIKASTRVLSIPKNVLMPIILLMAIVGAYAANNTFFDVTIMLVAGVIAFLMEENGFPIAPALLGIILGPMIEDNFVNSMIKSDGNLIGLIDRPIAAVLATITVAIIAWFVLGGLRSALLPRKTQTTNEDSRASNHGIR